MEELDEDDWLHGRTPLKNVDGLVKPGICLILKMMISSCNVKPMTTEIVFKTPITRLTLSSGFGMPKIVNPRNSGEYVALRMVKEEPSKTYFGIILGDMNLGVGTKQTPGSDTVELQGMIGNPAIFVPALKQIIYGVECWWRLIVSEQQLTMITDGDLDDWSEKARNQIERYAPIIAKYAEEDAARAAASSAATNIPENPPKWFEKDA